MSLMVLNIGGLCGMADMDKFKCTILLIGALILGAAVSQSIVPCLASHF